MSKKELAVRESGVQQWGEASKLLTKEGVRQYLCPKADDKDLYLFINFCRSKHLNPFIREAYLIKYKDTSPASIVTSKDAFFKRADNLPAYDGTKSGIIVRKGSQIAYREGYCKLEGEILVGGWAEVYRKDRKMPTRVEVSMSEYVGKKHNWKTGKDEINKMWSGKPATMITKVAEVQALRKTFPNDFGGMFAPEEMETGGQPLPETSIDLKQIKEKKETVIDVGEVVENKKEPEKKEPKEKATISKVMNKIGKKQDERIKKTVKETVALAEKLTPLEKKRGELKELIFALPIDDLEEKSDSLKLLQEKLGIPPEKTVKDFSKEDIEGMIGLLKKQFPQTEEKPKEKPKEEKRVLRKGEFLCIDCGKNILREGTKTYDFAMKNFKAPVCFTCGRIRQEKNRGE